MKEERRWGGIGEEFVGTRRLGLGNGKRSSDAARTCKWTRAQMEDQTSGLDAEEMIGIRCLELETGERNSEAAWT